jgi:hypothetical protein
MPRNWLINILEYFRKIWFLWLISLVLVIITFLWIFIKIHPGNSTLALHYDVLVGVEWYGKGKNLYFIPGIGLLISAVNFTFYKALKNTESLLTFLSVFISICVQVILLISVIFLSRVN